MASLWRGMRTSWRKAAGWLGQFFPAGAGAETAAHGASFSPMAMVAALRTALAAGLVIGFTACAVLLAFESSSATITLSAEVDHNDGSSGEADRPLWLSDLIGGLAAGIALSSALPAIPDDGASSESLLSLRLRLAAVYSRAALEARGFDSDIRFTAFAAGVVLLLRCLRAGVLATFTSAFACAIGIVAAAGYGGVGTTFLLGLFVPLSLSFGMLHMFLVGVWLGSLGAVRFWIRFLQDKLLYHPRGYSGGVSWGERFDFGGLSCSLQQISYSIESRFSGELPQTAMLVKPEASRIGALWVVCGGNSMLATDWLPHIDRMLRLSPPAVGMAFLLLDYPGYGWNSGRPSPSAILAASRAGVQKALAAIPGPQPHVNLLGHSLGSAAVAQLATQLSQEGLSPGRMVLSAPFLDIPSMAMCVLGGLIPPSLRPLFPPILRLLVPHRWDNASQVPRAAKAGWKLSIVHGALDELVPCYMGRQLFSLATRAVFLGETVEAHSLLTAALNGARGKVVGVQGERLQIDFGGGQESKAVRQQNVTLVGAGPSLAAGSARAPSPVDAAIRTDFLEVPAAGHNDVLAAAKEIFAELLRSGCSSSSESANDAI
mmetsp:Transcript_35997/g.84377  ORF Transcript_35997/g.84377 Transcript_35997/m.84377 type:complete len:602 (+) Transcript_35997:40-1845(+)